MNNLSGKMDRRVLLQASQPGENSEPNPVKVDIATVWAAKEDEKTIKEGPEYKTIVATGRTLWTIRYRTDIDPTTWLTDLSTGIEYNVIGIIEIPRRQGWQLETKRNNA